MRLASRPARPAHCCAVLAFALWFATRWGLLHRTIHGPAAAQTRAVAVVDEGRGEP
ncbi:hypothetical protein [Variovorax sp. WS11]|uniref:hypothetical protein n=1 Tax=Variovorax sp. WS11 TaxID=1105204 RepID=UPI001EF20A09|nr:hypothetical protein [Variovorax sp. WS11]